MTNSLQTIVTADTDTVTTAMIRTEIISQVTRRALKNPTSTICPSEVTRALWPDRWRARMQAVREVAYMLCDAGEIEVTQGGVAHPNPRLAKGAIRLRLKRASC